MSIKQLKDKVSIGRKWLVNETITIQSIAKFQDTSYGEVVVFNASTDKGDELIFTGGKAIVELFKQADRKDFPLFVKLVERLSANKRTYQDIEDGDEE
jgi:hypothetical protein